MKSSKKEKEKQDKAAQCTFINLFIENLLLIIYSSCMNIITYSPYSPYYVTRTSTNGNVVYWSRDFRLYYVTRILHCHWLKMVT